VFDVDCAWEDEDDQASPFMHYGNGLTGSSSSVRSIIAAFGSAVWAKCEKRRGCISDDETARAQGRLNHHVSNLNDGCSLAHKLCLSLRFSPSNRL
jgi:hypothetical protein